MNETVFETDVNGETIHGIRHQPVGHGKNTAVVLLHGWAGYRTGPHDMLVKIAGNLTVKGYDCFRFDFRGKGYSRGDRRNTDNRSMLQDLDSVLQHVNQVLNQPRIILAGICSGAKLALYYARNGIYPVAHVIEISSPVLRKNEVEAALAAGQAKSSLKEYAKKVFRMDTWRKLTGGEIYFQAVWHNIIRPVKQRFTKKSKKTVFVPRIISQTHEKPFANFKGHMLLIHGEKDPEAKPALEQIHEMLRRYRIPFDTHIIKNANHSFYSIAWEKEIMELIAEWPGKK